MEGLRLKSIHDQARDSEKNRKRNKPENNEVLDEKITDMIQSILRLQ